MTLSKHSLATLIDLVENKLSCMDVWDREDRREAQILKHCLDELTTLSGGSADIIAFAETRRRRGRPPRLRSAV